MKKLFLKKTILLTTIFTLGTPLLAYNDQDLDGVRDEIDECPNTPFLDLVNKKGCTIKSLVSPHHYDIITGISYSNDTSDSVSSSLQFDYYYKKFSLQASLSYYANSSTSGFNDTFIGAYYQIKPLPKLSFNFGLGVLLPTYDSTYNNNNTDYQGSMSVSYKWEKYNFFGSYSYTIVNDDDIKEVDANNVVIYSTTYQNTNYYSTGVGYYFSNKLYMSGRYSLSNSIYTDGTNIEKLSTYFYYSIDNHWFSTFSYAYGLSNSATDNYISLKLGYFF